MKLPLAAHARLHLQAERLGAYPSALARALVLQGLDQLDGLMAFNATLPELADLNEQLPYPNTIAEAYWLAEVACMCHRRLQASHKAPAEFWTLLNTHEAKRLRGFLRDASDGVSNAANDLNALVDFAQEVA